MKFMPMAIVNVHDVNDNGQDKSGGGDVCWNMN